MLNCPLMLSQPETDQLLRLRAKLFPPYKVILFDDDYNDMHYVVVALLHAVNDLSQPSTTRSDC